MNHASTKQRMESTQNTRPCPDPHMHSSLRMRAMHSMRPSTYLPPDNAPVEAPLGTSHEIAKALLVPPNDPSSTTDASVGDPTTDGELGIPGPERGYDWATIGGLPGQPVDHIQAAPEA